MSKSLPRVLIVYNEPVLPADHPDAASEADILETVVEVEKVLIGDEFVLDKFGYSRNARLMLDKLDAWKPDVVFNLYEGEADRSASEVYHAALLEWANVSFTGSPSYALAFGRDKVRTKYLLQGAGLPTAGFQVIDALTEIRWTHDWPAMVKPAYQDASVGIDQGSVVTSQAELTARVEYLRKRFDGPVLVEQFINGREFHVNLFDEARELHVVPSTELKFQVGTGYWPIYSYEGKWNEASVEYKGTALQTGVTLPSPLQARVDSVCRDAYRLVGMRDFGRVDVRITEDGTPYVLEVNPNPYLNSIGLVDGLKAMGRAFPGFIQGLVQNALARSRS